MKTARSLPLCAALLVLGITPAFSASALVKDIVDGALNGFPTQIMNVDGVLYFQADSVDGSEKLWRSDGTAAGTFRIKDIYPGAIGSHPESFVVHKGEIYFLAGGEDGDELWKTDGTEAGTVQIADINPGDGNSLMRFFTANESDMLPAIISVGDLLYFAADDGESGFELWKSDGTEAGTQRVKDIYPGPDSSIEAPVFASVGNTVFFFAMDTMENGIELWKSDGTEVGTVLVESINDVVEESAFQNPFDVDGIVAATSTHVFFRGFDGQEFGVFASDGTGVIKLVGSSPDGVVSPNFIDSLTVWKDRLYFRADTQDHGAELWVSDGTPAGTEILNELRSGQFSTIRNSTEMVPSNGLLFFACDIGQFPSPGQELCRTDGTSAGTKFIREIEPGTGFSSPTELVDVNGILFFVARTTELGRELYRSDGTPDGTYLAEDLVPGSTSGSPVELTAFEQGLVFRYNDRTHGQELHRFCCDSRATQTFAVLDDTTGNGAPEIASFRVDPAERMEVRVHDASTAARSVLERVFSTRWQESALLGVAGAGTGGGPAFAVAATLDTGRPGIQLRDGGSGAWLRNLFPWSTSWATVDTTIVPGAANGGADAVATLSRRISNGALGIEMRDPTDNSQIASFFLLGRTWNPLALIALRVNGQDAFAVVAQRPSDGHVLIQTRNALNGTRIGNQFPLGLSYRPIEFQRLPDMNGNGADEIASMMERISDGLVVIQIRDSLTGNRIANVFPIGQGRKAWRIVQFRAINFNGTQALAVLSVNRDTNQVLVQVKNAMNGAVLTNVLFIAPPWEFHTQFEVIADFTGNGFDEIIVAMRHSGDGRRIMQTRDSQDASVIKNVNVPK